MTFFKAATTSVPPLRAHAALWADLIAHLREQGEGTRESGAFLLGIKTDTGRVVTQFLPYEQLQPDALHEDYVALNAASFARLWDICHTYRVSVVADVHTHRFGPGQSRSDRANPMVALRGHIALIVPRFAQGHVCTQDVGLYVYEGNHMWTAHSGPEVGNLIQLS